MHANFSNEGFSRAIIDDEASKYIEFHHLIKMDKYRNIWMKFFAIELGRLAQGICDVPGTDTIDFIPHADVPVRTTVTYGRIFCTYCPQKTEKHLMRLTFGGNMFICLYDVSAPTSDMTIEKMLSNSVISMPGAHFITLDLKNFYLKTPFPEPRYMKMKIDILPDDIIKKYNLGYIVYNEYVYFKIKMGMYGIPEAGILSKKLLKKRLSKHGYYKCQFTPVLFRHLWRPIM